MIYLRAKYPSTSAIAIPATSAAPPLSISPNAVTTTTITTTNVAHVSTVSRRLRSTANTVEGF